MFKVIAKDKLNCSEERIHSAPNNKIFKESNIEMIYNKTSANKETYDIASVNNNTETNCAVCFNENSDSMLVPCCHGGICFNCCIEISKNDAKCPYCRKVISNKL